jgi:hypothetical protein
MTRNRHPRNNACANRSVIRPLHSRMPALSRIGRRRRTGRHRPTQTVASSNALQRGIYSGPGCDMHRGWFPYVAAGAITVAIVVVCLTAIRLGV